MRIVIGCDPSGFPLKGPVTEFLQQHPLVTEVIDVGVSAGDDRSKLYPQIGREVGEAVASGQADRGLAFCGNGLGVTLAANEVKGAIAVTADDILTVRSSVTVNKATVLCMGANIVAPRLATVLIDEWLQVDYPAE